MKEDDDDVVGISRRGARVMLPWLPLRTASGGGRSRADEVHDELRRRVEATRGRPGAT